ncbi:MULTISPECIES: FAD-linked oxidase C-terminal domain-containing protein [Delftia]|uniref:Glycolate oxidase n=1 Tax=Delftia lacustris TaxID=558537 RepID=A0A1H3EPP6_9BURK|nr:MULTISPECIES: FAD-linked oxidase C-terminal domain-containing protein [Delftia]MDH0771981.1 FAD-binding protein [Delftia tsuruhatensis]MDH0846948.1 FAD-binding protein [Delftia tsuruhatensis]MDH1456499.1 FAD-binding protein [Delftia tsuruhatensis]MDH1822518.1 FAD-binding protein [Delftia tsuruhatensis]WEM01785.1 FAD-linked oxidase C-terminal domain-containing protein [Delftia tsuruhatensis]
MASAAADAAHQQPTASERARRQAEVVAALARHVPAHALLWNAEDTTPYECDGLTAYRQRPLVVCLPETEAQVQAVLRACHAIQVPVIARGAGTGLSGGALPHPMGVTLSLAKFNKILQVDAASRTAVVQCGVRNLAISEAAAPLGLYYAPDPSSQIACTIGGNVAENSGGVHCLKYGLTVHNVLKVRGFTVEGEPVEFGSMALDTPGFDLLAILVGSEGMLAVTTEVTVRLIPKPQLARCIMASFDDVRKAGDAVAAVIAAGIIPAGLEMMDKPMTAAVEDFVKAGYDLTAEAILLCESDGTPEEVEEEIAHMSEVLRGAGATAITVSESEAERLRFWSGRKNAFPASGRISPDYMCMDSTIPRKRLADILLAIQEMEKKYGLRCANVFHAGDGNLHPLILFDANDPDELHRCELFGADILETSVAMGGTVTGEHGVGVEKLNSMCTQFTTAENDQMFALKAAFDPQALLNPGKVIPTLNRCAEYGKMLVRGGQISHPDLPRF